MWIVYYHIVSSGKKKICIVFYKFACTLRFEVFFFFFFFCKNKTKQKKKKKKNNNKKNKQKTRTGVCKTLCPQLPDSNTVWLQHCLAMTVTTVQIYDFNVILSKGNNSKIGDDWDKKKIRITYFFMRNQNMKFQNISIHGSKLMLYTIKQRH